MLISLDKVKSIKLLTERIESSNPEHNGRMFYYKRLIIETDDKKLEIEMASDNKKDLILEVW